MGIPVRRSSTYRKQPDEVQAVWMVNSVTEKLVNNME